MANATSALNSKTKPLYETLGGLFLDSSQDVYYNGTALQPNGITNEVVSVSTSVAGEIVGYCDGNYDYTGTQTDRTLRVDIQPALRYVTISGGAVAKRGEPVWMTDDQTFTLTYTSGAKLAGFLWTVNSTVVLADFGMMNRYLLALSGGVWIRETYIIPATLLTTAFQLTYTADQACVITALDITNADALDASADVDFTYKKNNTGSALGTLEIDAAGKRAAGATADIIASGGTALAKGDTIDIYTATVAAQPSAGIFQIELSGYRLAR